MPLKAKLNIPNVSGPDWKRIKQARQTHGVRDMADTDYTTLSKKKKNK